MQVIDPSTADIRPWVMGAAGAIEVMPAANWERYTAAERALFGLRMGAYHFPTTELVNALKQSFKGRQAIEVCAGRGDLCRALEIDGYDNCMQDWPDIAAYYAVTRQPTVPYGIHVKTMDANKVAASLRPDVIVAAWMTHRYDPANPAAGGNAWGPDHHGLLANCRTLVFIGNTEVHRNHPLLNLPHARLAVPVVSRAQRGKDFVAFFEGSKS